MSRGVYSLLPTSNFDCSDALPSLLAAGCDLVAGGDEAGVASVSPSIPERALGQR